MIKNPEDQNDAKIKLIDDALLQNVAGGMAGGDCTGPGDCTNHGGCKEDEEEEQEEEIR